jgi:hypothetical protein
VAYKDIAPQIRQNFLRCLAALFSDHTDFWNGRKLQVAKPLRRKLGQFQLNAPEVQNLASSGNNGRDMLYLYLREHVNRGKRTKHLSPRHAEMSETSGSSQATVAEEGGRDRRVPQAHRIGFRVDAVFSVLATADKVCRRGRNRTHRS